MEGIIIIISITTILVSFFISWILKQRKNIKGPKTWPIFGASIELLINYHRMHDWLFEYLSKSKTFKVPLPGITLTYTSDPANIEHILKTNFPNYPKGEAFHSNMEVLLGDGIFNSDGEIWKKQRKTSSYEFASKNLRDFSTIVFKDYALKLSRILTQVSISKDEIDMQELVMKMTMDTICKVGFGVEIGSLDPHDRNPDELLPHHGQFARAFDIASSTVTFRFVDLFWRIKRFFNVGSEALLNHSIQVIDEFTYSLIQRRKAEILEQEETNGGNQIKHDILSRFIELSKDPDTNLTDKSLRDVIINFIMAGRDTTASTLTWFIYMMIMNPNVEDKLYSELKSFEEDRAKEENVSLLPCDLEHFTDRVSQFASLLTYDSVGKLTYLHAAITETLRLYPAVPQDPKGILRDDVLPDGTKVRAGGLVTYVPYSMGRLDDIWGPDSISFNPERWLNEDGVFQSASPFKFAAFQAGPRTCLGKDSAYLQIKITLAILFRFFNFNLVPGHPVKYRMMTTLSMEHGLKLNVSIRSSNV